MPQGGSQSEKTAPWEEENPSITNSNFRGKQLKARKKAPTKGEIQMDNLQKSVPGLMSQVGKEGEDKGLFSGSEMYDRLEGNENILDVADVRAKKKIAQLSQKLGLLPKKMDGKSGDSKTKAGQVEAGAESGQKSDGGLADKVAREKKNKEPKRLSGASFRKAIQDQRIKNKYGGSTGKSKFNQPTDSRPKQKIRENDKKSSKYSKLKRGIQEKKRKIAELKQSLNVKQQIKQKTKAVVKRGILYLINLLSGALDLSSGFISTLITGIIYTMTFTIWNLQMFYGSYLSGYWMTKKKSKYIDPLDWEPLPIPLSPIILHIALLAADIAIVIIGVLAIGFAAFLMGLAVEVILGLTGGGISSGDSSFIEYFQFL